MRRTLVVLALLASVGCDDGPPPPPLRVDSGPVEPGAVVWGSCEDSRSSSCAQVEVPLDWDAPDGPTFPVVLRRVRGASPSRQLWILDGGPGGDVDAWESFARRMTEVDPRLTVYLFHQRGTGRSQRLRCAAEEAASSPGGTEVIEEEHAACIASLTEQFGPGLAHMSATSVARDLVFLVDATRQDDEEVVIMGTSYGAYLAQRYLQLAPDQPTGVVMSGIPAPDLAYPDRPATFTAVAREVFAACGADPFCAERLGPDPAATMEGLLPRLDEGHCPLGDGTSWTRRSVQQIVASLFYDWSARAVALAFVHRLNRCSEADRAALSRFRRFSVQSAGTFSWMLFAHVVLSELWTEDGPTLDEARELQASGLLGDASLANLIQLRSSWPRYALDEYDDQFADSDVPMLMMNGSLDPATVLSDASRVGANFDGPGQTFVTIEGGGHGFGAPLEDGTSCAMSMIEAFILDPQAEVDNCGGRVRPPDFRGTTALASTTFGTADLWDDPEPGALTYVPPPDAALAAHLTALLEGREPPPRIPGR